MTAEPTSRLGGQQHLLIKSLSPKQGEPFEVGTVTAFVGDGNVGKSEALRDIARLAGKFDPGAEDGRAADEPQTKVIADLTFVPRLTVERLTAGLSRMPSPTPEQIVVQGVGPDLKTPLQRVVGTELKTILFRPVMTARSVWMTALGDLMPLRVAFWEPAAVDRIIATTPARGPTEIPENLLQDLQYAPAEIHQRLDAAFSQAFPGRRLKLDDTQRLVLTLRVAAEFPELAADPAAAVHQFAKLDRLEDEGDGCRSFAAVLLCLLAARGRIVLLDQPDAFLQPAQARELGAWIAAHAPGLECQVFVAAPSPALLEGFFRTPSNTTLVTMTRRGGATRMRHVPSDAGEALARFPLFASQQGLDRLLQRSVVVVPDADEAMVYQTVAQRQLACRDVGFLHAHGVANVTFVAKVLRKAHVPVCVVTALDLFQNESGFTELVTAVTGAPPPRPWLATRERLASHIEGWFDESNLSSSTNEVEQFIDQMKQGPPAATATPSQADESPTAGARAVSRHRPAGPPPANVAEDRGARWAHLKSDQLDALPPELRIWVEELIEDLKQKGIFVSARGRLQSWFDAGSAADPPTLWINRAMRSLHSGQCPPELRALVADMTTFDGGASLPRAARRSHST